LFTGILELTEDRSVLNLANNEAIEIRSVCQSVITPLAAGHEKGLRVEYRVGDEVPQWLWSDRRCLEQALALLLDNAVKFTADGSVLLHVFAEDKGLVFDIRDTGCGIDLDRLSELRQPFVQGDLSTTKEYPGFGLGLALSDLCVRALGGALRFEQNQPHGTAVSFRLPLRRASRPAQVPVARPTPGQPLLPILVVEDNVINRKVMQMTLERLGYKTHFCVNGAQALDAMEQGDYSCILMDCQMPVMDGYEATRRIRQREARSGKHIPIVAVTANALAHDRALCLEAGMDDYLKKPVHIKELQSTIETYVGRPANII